MESIDDVVDYINVQRDHYVEELKQYLAIPSISALPEHSADVRRCAEWSADQMRQIGLQNVRLIETPGNPVAYGDWLGAPGAPTILFYGHYDVQPVDPLDLWHTPPFEPRIEDGILYARGSTDDKGQFYAHLKALEAYVRTGTELPVNLKFILEGEEECGGRHIYRYTEQNAERMACDAVIISDTALYNETTPGICYSLKGLTYMEIRVSGPSRDLHSGSYGGVAYLKPQKP